MIRTARAADAHGIAAVLRDCWPDDTPELDRIASLAGDACHALLVAEVDGACVGVVDAFPTVNSKGVVRWELDLLAVVRVARGLGIGRALIRAALRAATPSAVIARALIRVGNAASEGAFRAAGLRGSEPELALYVTETNSAGGPAPSCSHLVAVQTLLYGGIWLEGEATAAALEAARRQAGPGATAMVGMLVPAGTSEDRACDGSGFRRAGQYRWWTCELIGAK